MRRSILSAAASLLAVLVFGLVGFARPDWAGEAVAAVLPAQPEGGERWPSTRRAAGELWGHEIPTEMARLGPSVLKQGYIWGSQGGVRWVTQQNLAYKPGELKLPDKVPNNFPGNWGFFNVQAAVVPIASMTNTVVLVGQRRKVDRIVEPVGQALRVGPRTADHISPYDPERHVWVIDDMRHVILQVHA
jgi:hypothetical protein